MTEEVLDPRYPQINAVLLRVRQELRTAVESGGDGDWVAEPLAYFSRSLGTWQSGLFPKEDLTTLPTKR